MNTKILYAIILLLIVFLGIGSYVGYTAYTRMQIAINKNASDIKSNSDYEIFTRLEVDKPIQECKSTGLVSGSPTPCYAVTTSTKITPHLCTFDSPQTGIITGLCSF